MWERENRQVSIGYVSCILSAAWRRFDVSAPFNSAFFNKNQMISATATTTTTTT
jgi:hypothetical protein